MSAKAALDAAVDKLIEAVPNLGATFSRAELRERVRIFAKRLEIAAHVEAQERRGACDGG